MLRILHRKLQDMCGTIFNMSFQMTQWSPTVMNSRIILTRKAKHTSLLSETLPAAPWGLGGLLPPFTTPGANLSPAARAAILPLPPCSRACVVQASESAFVEFVCMCVRYTNTLTGGDCWTAEEALLALLRVGLVAGGLEMDGSVPA
jgi:hypothetical protein